jgi:amino acid adenylation domain-containing protein
MIAPPTLLTRFLDDAATTRAQTIAAEDALRHLTFGQMRDAAMRIGHWLQSRGVGPGDRVILSMANSVTLCAAFWGTLYAGAVAVPLNPDTKPAKLRFIHADCTPKAVICDDDLADLHKGLNPDAAVLDGTQAASLADGVLQAPASLAAPVSVIDQDLAAIIYTSGSTGDPKGVMLSHLNMTTAARSVCGYLGYTAQDRVFCCIPMTFDYGLHQLTMTTLAGATLIVEPSFAQPLFALKRLAQSRATVFPIVPTMVPLIAPLADRFDLRSVRCISSTSAALHGTFIDRLAGLFPDARIFSMYGLTECHRCTYLDPDQLQQRKTSVGKAIPNTRMWVVDAAGVAHSANAVGELVIQGSTVMKGYWRNPAKTAEKLRSGPIPGEMVLYTGDTCRIDAEGYLYFISRSDDILKVGGEKVAPSEVDATLITHPAVAEVCSFGIEHPVYGQQCIAAVVLKTPGDDAPSDRALRDWCATLLEPHAVPARVWVVPAIPRNGNNKVDRHQLLASYHEASQPRSTGPISAATSQPAQPAPTAI